MLKKIKEKIYEFIEFMRDDKNFYFVVFCLVLLITIYYLMFSINSITKVLMAIMLYAGID